MENQNWAWKQEAFVSVRGAIGKLGHVGSFLHRPLNATADDPTSEANFHYKLIFNFLLLFRQANGLASVGKYAAGSVVGAGADATLFVANHAY